MGGFEPTLPKSNSVHPTAKENEPAENLGKKLGKLSAESAPNALFGSG
jgi:hypothetical protein